MNCEENLGYQTNFRVYFMKTRNGFWKNSRFRFRRQIIGDGQKVDLILSRQKMDLGQTVDQDL